MRKCIYLLCLPLFSFLFSFAAPKIQLSAISGIWFNSSSWNLNRLPANGDTIVVPPLTTLVVSGDLSLSNVHIRIYGTVSLLNLNTQINLDGQSDIMVYGQGIIQGSLASQKIRIAGFNEYQGNMAPVLGPTYANAFTGGFQYTVLPVRFLGFQVARRNNNVLVNWSTTQEINASGYELERSLDANTWTRIATIPAMGNSQNINNYSYTDPYTSASTVYYRLKQVDGDGKFTYTLVKAAEPLGNGQGITLAALPNELVLHFSRELGTAVSIRLISLGGQVLQEQQVAPASGQIVLSTHFKGHYLVAVSNGNDLSFAQQVIL